MKIAIPYGEKGRINQHFGHTTTFRIYNIENDQVESISMLDTNGVSHCALTGFLKENNVDVLICGGIGPGAINGLNKFEIKVVPGVNDDCDIAVAKFLANKLQFSLEANCEHDKNHVARHKCHTHEDGECHHCE